MRIHIIGGSGTGKSTLAKKLAARYNIPHYDLDEIQWDNSAAYGTKRDPAEKQRMLNDIVTRPDWITEGVYYAWVGQCFEKAEKIYLLDVPRATCRYRIVRRFLRRKLKLEPGKKETLKSLRALLKWTDKYRTQDMPEIRKLLAPYGDKVVTLTGREETPFRG